MIFKRYSTIKQSAIKNSGEFCKRGYDACYFPCRHTFYILEIEKQIQDLISLKKFMYDIVMLTLVSCSSATVYTNKI